MICVHSNSITMNIVFANLGNAFLRLFFVKDDNTKKITCRKPTRIMYHVRIAKVNWSCIFRDTPNQMSFHHTIGRVNCDIAWTSLVSCIIAWSNYMWAAVTTLAEREDSQKNSPCVTVQVWEWISNFSPHLKIVYALTPALLSVVHIYYLFSCITWLTGSNI